MVMRMIIVKISDGFGNQLFMYACAYSIARKNNQKLYLDASILDNNKLRKLELTNLNIEYDKLISYRILKYKPLILMGRLLKDILIRICTKRFNEKQCWVYDRNIMKVKGNVYLDGYWQSHKYFDDSWEELVQMITPQYQHCEDYVKIKLEIESNNSVAIHIRRGDYIKIGCCIDKHYYQEAINIIENRCKDIIYYVFSDDIEFAETMFRTYSTCNFVYLDYKSDNKTLDDFFLMSLCKHQIIANSSFSWWAAWINKNSNKIVIAPQVKSWKDDFYPSEWIKIGTRREG